ncbi:MAG: hypothetical protein KBD23_04175 [Gammaproteobacteria bacterium]|nr:hypothetical protein [Gammaproteobacteria bacterium]MBP9729320.1 hypothetical protein [Gammaproteobacteria bacterium]
MNHVVFSLGFSKSLAFFLSVIYSFAALIVWMLPLALFVQSFLCLGLLCLFIQTGQRHLSRSHKGSVVSVWQDSKGRWGCTLQDGRCLRGRLSADTFMHPYLLVLGLRTSTGTRYVPIPGDALDSFGFRTLSTRIRFFE